MTPKKGFLAINEKTAGKVPNRFSVLHGAYMSNRSVLRLYISLIGG